MDTMEGIVTHKDEDYYVSEKRRPMVVIALALILFISALDATIVSVALPKIGADFNSYQETSWIVTAYLVTYTAFLPIVSKLTDIIGRKPVLIVSTLFFMAFSGACGGAKTIMQLIIFRAFQGIGGSAIYSGVIVTISTMVPQREVAKYSSAIGAVFATSSVAGPLIGGAIVQNIHWGWIFFVNLPIGFIGVVLLQLFLDYPAARNKVKFIEVKRRIDWIGALLLLAAALLLSLSLQIGGTPSHPWTSASVLAPLVISIILIPIFIWVETTRSEPVLPLGLFRLRTALQKDSPITPSSSQPLTANFTLAVFFTLCLGASMFGTVVFMTQRLQIVSSLSPTSAAVKMIPYLLLTGVFSALAGAAIMATKSYRPLMWFGSSIGAISGGLLSTIGSDGGAGTAFDKLYGFEVMGGIAFGITITASTIIVQFSVDRKDLATATGFQTFARMLGGLISIAISTAILNARVHSKLNSAALVSPMLLNPDLRQAIIDSPLSVIPTLETATQALVKQAYDSGFSVIFVVVGIWFALGTVATLGLKHVFPAELKKEGDVESDEVEKVEPSEETPKVYE